MSGNSVLLSTAYFPPIQYVCKIFSHTVTTVEVFENYSKQSYRNRCVIYGANGPLTLSIPIVKEHNKKTLSKDVRIDYDINWQKNHLKSIESAYRSSPFYEYYIDDLLPFFKKKYDFLVDYNLDILEVILEFIDSSNKYSIRKSKEYIQPENIDIHDYRDSIHPKKNKNKPDPFFKPVEYFQVFENKLGFIQNLSVLDLLFNEGNMSLSIVKNSIV